MQEGQAAEVVLETLSRATSQNSEFFKPAERLLREWESQPGFYSILLVNSYTIGIRRTHKYLTLSVLTCF